jgi:ribosomal-protein-alanine N-acetyltransferase
MTEEATFEFGAFPRLETPRLVLRELVPEDAPAVLVIRGDYEVTKYNGGMNYTRVDQAQALVASIRDAYRDKRSVRWGITLKGGDDTVIGVCGFNYWIRADHRASIGYDLARAHWRQGYMTEAIRAILAFGFDAMALKRIEADASSPNIGSIRVLEKVGFLREGTEREIYSENGEIGELVLFSMRREDFRTG